MESIPFPDLVRQFRKTRGWTQDVLGEKIARCAQTISRIERCDVRKPHRATVLRIADAFDLGEVERAAFLDAYDAYPPVKKDKPPSQRGQRAARDASPLVGRDHEIDLMRQALHARRGSPRVFVGERGVGKSALLGEYVRLAQDANWCVLCESERNQGESFPFQHDIEALARTTLAAPQIFAGLSALLAYSPLLARHLELPFGTTSYQLSEVMDDVVTLVRQRLTGHYRGVLLIYDDLHVIDNAWWDVLLHLVTNAQQDGCLFVGAVPDLPREFGPVQSWLKANDDVAWHQLLRFSREDTRVYIDRRFAAPVVSEAESRLLYERTGGLPYYLKGIADMRQQGQTEVTSLPPTIGQFLRQRIAALRTPLAGEILLVLALGEPGMERRHLAAIARHVGWADPVVDVALQELIACHLLRMQGVFLQCDHLLVREALLTNQPPFSTAGWHLTITKALADQDVQVAVLAHHASQSDDLHLALRYVERAMEAAYAAHIFSGSAHSVKRWCGTIFTLAKHHASVPPHLVARAHELLGVAYLIEGRFKDARRALLNAGDGYRHLSDHVGSNRVVSDLLRTYHRQGQVRDGIKAAKDLLPIDDAQITEGQMHAYLTLSYLYEHDYDPAQQLAAAQQALAFAQHLGDPGLVLRARAALARADMHQHPITQVVEQLQGIITEARSYPALLRCRIYCDLAMADLFSGRTTMSGAQLDEALHLARQLHERHLQGIFLLKLGEVSFFRGQWDQSLAHLNEALHVLARSETTWPLPFILNGMATIHANRAEVKEMHARIAQASELLTTMQLPMARYWLTYTQVDYALQTNKWEEAAQTLARTPVGAKANPIWRAHHHLLTADVLRNQAVKGGKPALLPRAKVECLAGIRLARQIGYNLVEAEGHRILAHIVYAEPDPDAAYAALQTGIALCETAECPFILGRLSYEMGAYYKGRGTASGLQAARTALYRAHDAFAPLDAQLWLRKVKQALDHC